MSQRISKPMRLRKRADYVRVQQTGRKLSSPALLAIVTKSSVDISGRLGITVSSRVGNAVTRNRIKRFVREWFRQNQWPPVGSDVVVIARNSAARARCFADLAPSCALLARQIEKCA